MPETLGGVAAQVLVGHEEDLLAGACGPSPRPGGRSSSCRPRPPCARPGLSGAGGVHVRDDRSGRPRSARSSWSAIGSTMWSLASISMVQPALGLVIQTCPGASWARIAMASAMKWTADSTRTFFCGLSRACRAPGRSCRTTRAAVVLDDLDDLPAHVEVGQEEERVAEVVLGRLRRSGPATPRTVSGLPVGQRQVLLGVGPKLLLVPVEGQVRLADRDAGLQLDSARAGIGGAGKGNAQRGLR